MGPRQFLYVLALRPYSPGGVFKALAVTLINKSFTFSQRFKFRHTISNEIKVLPSVKDLLATNSYQDLTLIVDCADY